MKLLIDKDKQLTKEVVQEYIQKHSYAVKSRFNRLKSAYYGDYAIYHSKAKPTFKPDNRASTPFAKNIVDTFTGFFDGEPMKVQHENTKVQDVVDYFNDENNTIDVDFEIIKNACIYGHSAELLYQNENGETKTAVLSPFNAFVVYSNDVEQKPVFAVHYNRLEDNVLKGNVYTVDVIYSFTGGVDSISELVEEQENVYNDVPLIEYDFNRERQGIYEQVLSLIDVYNRTISDKANDIEYFSDAYLAILGADLNQEDLEYIRDNRIINLTPGIDEAQAKVEFIGKPDADTSQEHLLERLRDDIYNGSMVANINDDDFGNASGISLRYKLLSQENLAKTVERNITKSLKQRYKILFSLESNIPQSLADEYKHLNFIFKRNLPINLLDEAQTLQTLDGLVSDETKLQQASFIPDAKDELARIEEEQKQNVSMFQTDNQKEELIDNEEEKQVLLR